MAGDKYIGFVPFIGFQQIFAMGFGIFFGTLNCFLRDIGHNNRDYYSSFWFWLTPISLPVQGYALRGWDGLLRLNPMTGIVQGYQTIFLHGFWPIWEQLWLIAILAVSFFVLGYKTFLRLDKEMVDEL